MTIRVFVATVPAAILFAGELVSLKLCVASDGSTYDDAALTMPARLRPTP